MFLSGLISFQKQELDSAADHEPRRALTSIGADLGRPVSTLNRPPPTSANRHRILQKQRLRTQLDMGHINEIPIVRPGEYWRAHNRERLSRG